MPKLFDDIYGQKSAVTIVSSQLKTGKLSHAYLFLGPDGAGKEYFAREFSRYLICGNLKSDDCQNCRLFDLGNHPDFIVINGIDGIKIEQIRNLIERLSLSPNISKRKVVLITKSDNLGIEASNALLKTLEEPPSDTIIILTATSEKSLSQTILSRTQRIMLNVLSASDIHQILVGTYKEKEVLEISMLAEGNIGEALRLLNDKAYKTEKEKIYIDISTLFNSQSIIEKFGIIENYEKSKKLKTLFGILFNVITNSVNHDLSHSEQNSQSKKLMGMTSLEARAKMAKKMLKIYADLDYNVNLRLVMEGLILEHLLND